MSDMFHWIRLNSELISLAVSILAIGISVWAYKKSAKTEKRMLEIEEAREQDRLSKQNKAFLTTRLLREKGDYLVIENKGYSEARDIKVKIDGKRLLEHPNVLTKQKEILSVGATSSFRYFMTIFDQTPGPFEIEITWTDDSGEPGHYKTTLTL